MLPGPLRGGLAALPRPGRDDHRTRVAGRRSDVAVLENGPLSFACSRTATSTRRRQSSLDSYFAAVAMPFAAFLMIDATACGCET